MTEFNCYLLKMSRQLEERSAQIIKDKARSKMLNARQADLKKMKLASKVNYSIIYYYEMLLPHRTPKSDRCESIRYFYSLTFKSYS